MFGYSRGGHPNSLPTHVPDLYSYRYLISASLHGDMQGRPRRDPPACLCPIPYAWPAIPIEAASLSLHNPPRTSPPSPALHCTRAYDCMGQAAPTCLPCVDIVQPLQRC